jgi:hypothetical protein
LVDLVYLASEKLQSMREKHENDHRVDPVRLVPQPDNQINQTNQINERKTGFRPFGSGFCPTGGRKRVKRDVLAKVQCLYISCTAVECQDRIGEKATKSAKTVDLVIWFVW